MPQPETARELLHRYGLPEDVLDGALCLHAQELAAVQRRDAAVWGVDTAAGKHILAAADLIDPTRGATPAVLPAPADRAAALTEAADEAENVAEKLRAHHEFERSTGALDVMSALRRLAAEAHTDTQDDGPPDTFPAWLAQRFDPQGAPWDGMSDDDRSYWEHQARAVRRAVERGGFKAVSSSPVSAAPRHDEETDRG